MPNSKLKALLSAGDPDFWDILLARTREASEFNDLFVLSSLRKKALARHLSRPGLVHDRIRLTILGGYSFYPFRELLEHLCEMEGFPCDLWVGEFDNYNAEILDSAGSLYTFTPHVVLLMASEQRCKYPGRLSDARELQQAEANRVVDSLLNLARRVHEKTRAEVIATNFMLPAHHDLGAYRSRTLGSDWSFRKWVNLELGLNAPPYLHICDLEFLANRRGGIHARDPRAWFESKQPCSSALLVDVAREVAHLILSLRRAPKKVLVLDLDNTLWGGVIADDGIEGIEIGDTSPRGEAFKAFQKYIASLKDRGTLLAVCSKNDHAKAVEVFEKHPEMILKMDDFVSFKANWEPKSDNIWQIAADLNLGLDSLAFVDDNAAEIDIVRQFAPGVATILLGPDASEHVAQLMDCRLFEPRNVTGEDIARTEHYRTESQRKALLASATNMETYLQSLEMEASIYEFHPVDVPRLAQLINKSNQFNLTTRRRTEADVFALLSDPDHICFSVRLKDRFGDHGLISVVIAKKNARTMEVDTWLMSCRVLQRQVEDEALNELARLSQKLGCAKLVGVYLRTPKNEMVHDFYPKMGFALTAEDENFRQFALELEQFRPLQTKIKITRSTYAPS